jgi:hypothetical protein
LLIALALLLAVAASPPVRPLLRVAARTWSHVVTAVAQTAVRNAHAQEVLDFRPVPPESAAALESRATRRRAAATAPATPGTPATPAVPKPPAVPSPSLPGRSGNIVRMGSDIHVEEDQVVAGDVVAVGGDIVVDGHVEGDVSSTGGDIYLNSTARVDGDVVCVYGRLHEQEGAVVGGQRVTAMGGPGKKSIHVPRRWDWDGDHDRSGKVRDVMSSMVMLFVWLGLAWGITWLAPGRTGAAVAMLKREPGQSALVGILIGLLLIPALIAVILLVVLLCITIIGIPLAIAALFGYFALAAVIAIWGYVVGAAALGEKVAGARGSGIAPGAGTAPATPPAVSLTRAALIGILAIEGLGIVGEVLQVPPVPVLGGLLEVVAVAVGIVALVLGSGALVRHEFRAGAMSRWWGGRGRPAAAYGAAPAAGPVAAGAGTGGGGMAGPAGPVLPPPASGSEPGAPV